jgi:ATP-dependent Clp protease protease subunit
MEKAGTVTSQNPGASLGPAMTSATSGLNLSDSVFERLLRERIIFLGTQVDDEIAN